MRATTGSIHDMDVKVHAVQLRCSRLLHPESDQEIHHMSQLWAGKKENPNSKTMKIRIERARASSLLLIIVST